MTSKADTRKQTLLDATSPSNWSSMANWSSMVAADTKSEAAKIFMVMSSDAMFKLLVVEHTRIERHCKSLGMLPDQPSPPWASKVYLVARQSTRATARCIRMLHVSSLSKKESFSVVFSTVLLI